MYYALISFNFVFQAKRAKNKSKIQTDAERIERILLQSLAKEEIIKQAICGDKEDSKPLKLSPTKAIREKLSKIEEKDDIFKLPSIDEKIHVTIKAEENEPLCPKKNYNVNIHKIDVNSSYFKSLPADIRHDILLDIKETRKQNSWAKLRELPVESQDFSSYQMLGLLRRRQVQVSLESAEKEMGGKVWSLSELESLLTEDGVINTAEKHAQKIANDENTRFLLVRDIAKAINDAKDNPQPSTSKEVINKEDLGDEFDLELQKAIQMSLEENEDEKEVEIIDKNVPIKLNQQQRQKFGATVQKHDLVRGFMMEYADMNDDDIHEMANATQVSECDSDLNDSFSQKFPNTDRYILYGTQQPENNKKEEFNLLDENKEEKKEIVITVDSISYKKEEDIFADIFQPSPIKIEKPSSPDIEVASISSSDDDTVDYEIPDDMLNKTKDIESSFVSEDGKVNEHNAENFPIQELLNNGNPLSQEKQKIENTPPKESKMLEEVSILTETNSSPPQKLTENENFWKNLNDDDELSEVKEISKELSENEKFWSDTIEENVTDIKGFEQGSLDISNGEIKFTLCPTKTLITKEQKSKAAEELRKIKTDLELKHMKEELHQQQQDYEKEKNKLNRQGTSITHQMSNDCKKLLKLFGIPFIQSPMEAEAQCAFLNAINMTDGTITDDSDVWLFGAQTVYKNFFVQKKMVMEYRMENVEKMFHLDRKKLIQLAMLVGSDYTVGINGVGAVTALEILSSFPTTPEDEKGTDQYQSMLSSLRKFRDWFNNGKQATSSAVSTLRSKLKNIEIFEGFPSVSVLRAYLEPMIDSSTEPFSWGQIDVESIMELTRNQLGWTRLKTEELINPVLKRLNEKKQSTIHDYFKTQLQKKVFDMQKLSKRVQKAVNRMGGEKEEEKEEEKIKKPSRKRAAPKKAKKEEEKNISTFTLSESDEEESPIKKSPKAEEIQIPVKDEKSPKNSSKFQKKEKPKVTRKRKAINSNEPCTSAEAIAESDEVSLFKKKPAPRIPETKQVIPQREKNKKEMEENKQKAIELFKNSKKSSGKKKK